MRFSCAKEFIGILFSISRYIWKNGLLTMVHDYHFDSVTSLFSTYHSYIVNKDYIVFFESNSAQNAEMIILIQNTKD